MEHKIDQQVSHSLISNASYSSSTSDVINSQKSNHQYQRNHKNNNINNYQYQQEYSTSPEHQDYSLNAYDITNFHDINIPQQPQQSPSDHYIYNNYESQASININFVNDNTNNSNDNEYN